MEFVAILAIVVFICWLEGLLYRKYAFYKLQYRCYFSVREAFEGDEITLVEEVSNAKLLPLPWLKAELTTSKWLDFAGSQSLVTEETRFVPSFFMMKSRHKVVRSWKVRCLKRGEFTLEKVILISADLLGSQSLSQPVEVGAVITVLPKPADLTLGFQKVRSDSGPVIVRRHLLPDPFLIAGIREYTPHDSASRIHWPLSVRQGKLMVRNNEYSADQSLAIILNIQSREFERKEVLEPQKIEIAIRICAGFLDDTLRSGIPVGLWANASLTHDREPVITPFLWGREHVQEIFRVLSRLPLYSTDFFPTFLQQVCTRIQASDMVLVTAYMNDDIIDFASIRQAMGIRVKIILISHILPENLPTHLEIYQYWNEEEKSYE